MYHMESTTRRDFRPEILDYNHWRDWLVCHTIPIIPKLQHIQVALKTRRLDMAEVNKNDIEAIPEAPHDVDV